MLVAHLPTFSRTSRSRLTVSLNDRKPGTDSLSATSSTLVVPCLFDSNEESRTGGFEMVGAKSTMSRKIARS